MWLWAFNKIPIRTFSSLNFFKFKQCQMFSSTFYPKQTSMYRNIRLVNTWEGLDSISSITKQTVVCVPNMKWNSCRPLATQFKLKFVLKFVLYIVFLFFFSFKIATQWMLDKLGVLKRQIKKYCCSSFKNNPAFLDPLFYNNYETFEIIMQKNNNTTLLRI